MPRILASSSSKTASAASTTKASKKRKRGAQYELDDAVAATMKEAASPAKKSKGSGKEEKADDKNENSLAALQALQADAAQTLQEDRDAEMAKRDQLADITNNQDRTMGTPDHGILNEDVLRKVQTSAMKVGKLATLRARDNDAPADSKFAGRKDAVVRNVVGAAFAKHGILVPPADSFKYVAKRLHEWRRTWRSVIHKVIKMEAMAVFKTLYSEDNTLAPVPSAKELETKLSADIVEKAFGQFYSLCDKGVLPLASSAKLRAFVVAAAQTYLRHFAEHPELVPRAGGVDPKNLPKCDSVLTACMRLDSITRNLEVPGLTVDLYAPPISTTGGSGHEANESADFERLMQLELAALETGESAPSSSSSSSASAVAAGAKS